MRHVRFSCMRREFVQQTVCQWPMLETMAGQKLLRDAALSISSSVGRTSTIGDQRLSHVVDPRTGVALEGTVEAIVVSERAGLADGWSTALLVLGADRESLRLVERAALQAYVFESGGRIAFTEGWASIEAEAPRGEVPASSSRSGI